MNRTNWGASLIPINTWNLIGSQMDELFSSFFSPRTFKTDFPVNVLYEKDENKVTVACLLEIALAGVSKERIKVTVTSDKENYLSINVSKNENAKDALYKGISDKKWHCSYALSDSHDPNGVTSEFVDGLLKIRVPIKKPKEPELKIKEIEVK